MRLKNEVVLVTGGSRGIGRAIALRFAREGADVALAARTQPSLDTTAKEIRALGRKALGIPCDVGDASQSQEMVRRAEEHFGRIDVLVHNAGYFCSMNPLHEMPEAEWDLTIRMNLTSAFYVLRAALPGMIARRRGSIILISSSAAKLAFSLSSPYSAAKAGLLGLTRAVAAEAGPQGIRVNALCPGTVLGTEMHDKVSKELHRMLGITDEQRVAAERNSALLRRLPNPEEIADAALFLASSDSGLLTGQTINVDGGMRCD